MEIPKLIIQSNTEKRPDFRRGALGAVLDSDKPLRQTWHDPIKPQRRV